MNVNYDKISKTFSKSRKNMKWEEIDYFLEKYLLPKLTPSNWLLTTILDIGCGSGRLLEQFQAFLPEKNYNYLWIDASKEMIKEAKKNFPEENFLVLDMEKLPPILAFPPKGERNKKFDYIFFIASFHHLDSLEKREEVLKKTRELLSEDWIIFMTNWSLKSEVHKEKYKKSEIKDSENKFWSSDFSIKIWDYYRYYHSFSPEELEYLFQKTWFQVIENREFDTKKNFISIVKK